MKMAPVAPKQPRGVPQVLRECRDDRAGTHVVQIAFDAIAMREIAPERAQPGEATHSAAPPFP